MDDTPKQSRALPIGVAAGLAVAVFGVLFAIRGSGGNAASGDPSAGETAEKPAEPTETAGTTEPTPTPTPAETTPDAQAEVAAASPDAAAAAAATPDAASVAAAAADAAELKAVVLTFVVTPEDAKPTIAVDGKTLSTNKFAVAPGDSVKVQATAPGFTAFEKTVTAAKDQPEMKVEIALKKEGAPPPRRPSRPRRPKVDL